MAILRKVSTALMLILLTFSRSIVMAEARALHSSTINSTILHRRGEAAGDSGLIFGNRRGREMLDQVVPSGPDPQHHGVPHHH